MAMLNNQMVYIYICVLLSIDHRKTSWCWGKERCLYIQRPESQVTIPGYIAPSVLLLSRSPNES